MSYIKIKQGLKDKGTLIPIGKRQEFIDKAPDIDLYESVFEYNEEHKKKFDETGTTSGMRDVVTTKLFWDFDNKSDPGKALKDANKLVGRLKENGFRESDIQSYFSGSKGATIVVEQHQELTPQQVQSICVDKFGKDLETLDTGIYDAARVLRIPYTMHQGSGMRKIPISHDLLEIGDMDKIREMASSDEIDVYEYTKSSKDVREFVVREEKKVKSPSDLNVVRDPFDFKSIDNTNKPGFLDLPKWYLQNGFFREGERSNALLCLASTYKNQGFHKEIAFRMLKGVAELQAQRTGMDRFSETELWTTIIMQVYGNNWKGGQYSTKDPTSWLYQYARKYNIPITDAKDTKPQEMQELGGDNFVRYAKSFYETRIYTGLKDLDNDFPITAGTNIGIIGAASSGKTALSLNILEAASQQGCISVFASLDMSKTRLYEKMLYKVTNGDLSREQLFDDYLKGKGDKYNKLIKERFANTYVFNRSAPDIESIRNYLHDVQELTGKPVRLLMIDYFERLSSGISDATASSLKIAGEIQDLLNDFPELTPITLVQPNKFSLSGGPDAPILSYVSIKGSSFLYQSFRQILSLWRPFFNPRDKAHDKFMEMAVLKNDLGELGTYKYSWRGKTGEIYPMDYAAEKEYGELIQMKEQRNNTTTGGDGAW